MSGAGGPSNFLGTRVMLTSLTEIRYSGTLHEIREPPYGSCITLANVISYGSEGRKGGGADEIPGSDQIFQLITFSTTDIKALDVIEQAPQLPDPYPNYQQHYNPYMMAPDPMWQQQPHQPQMWAQQQHFNNFPQHPNQESPKFQQQMPQKSPIQQPEPPKSKTPQPPTPSKKISSPKPPVSSIDMPKQVEKVQQEPAQPAIQSKPPKAEKRVVENTNGTTKITRQTASGTTIRYSVSSSADPSLANLSKPNPQPHPQTKQVISDQESQFRPISSNYRGNNSRGGGRGRARGNFSNHVANKVKVPESDFDFQESNAKFSKEQPETGADSDDEGQKFYQKSCFFDDISCEAKERAENDGIDRNERRARQNEERRINVETFGVAQSQNSYRGGRGGRGRGRGGARQFLNRNATGIPSNDNRPESRRQ